MLKARRGSPEKKSVSPRCDRMRQMPQAAGGETYIFEILQEVGNSFTLAIG